MSNWSQDATQIAERDFTAQPAAEPVAPCPKQKVWVGIELVDMVGAPVPGEEWQILQAGLVVAEGTLDSEGKAALREVENLPYSVRFPNLDLEAWEPAG